MVNLRRVGLRNLKWFGRGLGMGRGGVLPALNPSPHRKHPRLSPREEAEPLPGLLEVTKGRNPSVVSLSRFVD